MQQVVINLNVLLISRIKNAHNDHALIVVFWNHKAGFKGGIHVRRCLTVIRIAELQADKYYCILLERADITLLVSMHYLQQSINSFLTFFTRLSILLYC